MLEDAIFLSNNQMYLYYIKCCQVSGCFEKKLTLTLLKIGCRAGGGIILYLVGLLRADRFSNSGDVDIHDIGGVDGRDVGGVEATFVMSDVSQKARPFSEFSEIFIRAGGIILAMKR